METDGVEAERKRQGIPDGERQTAQHGTRHDPAQLAPCRDGRHPLQREDHDRQPADHTRGQIDELHLPHELEAAREARADAGSAEDGNLGQAQRQGRHVHQGEHPLPETQPQRAGCAFGKHQGEMHEERREQQRRYRIRPIEHPIQSVESSAERKCEDAEERDGQPEEVQRRLVVGAPHANPRADEQREDPNANEYQVHGGFAPGYEIQRELTKLLGSHVEERVVALRAFAARVKDVEEISM